MVDKIKLNHELSLLNQMNAQVRVIQEMKAGMEFTPRDYLQGISMSHEHFMMLVKMANKGMEKTDEQPQNYLADSQLWW